jgi:anti-anti-sigma factor
MTRGELVWRVAARGTTRIVAPVGRVDEASATAFAERLSEEIEAALAAGETALAIDLAEVDYMSSRGLRGLTLAQRRAGEAGIAITLARPNAMMREILAISRYDKVFPVVDDIDPF